MWDLLASPADWESEFLVPVWQESGLRVSVEELRSNRRGHLLSTPGRGGCGVCDCETAYDRHARVFEVQCLTVLAVYQESGPGS